MTRTKFKWFWLCVITVVLGASFFVFDKGQDFKLKTTRYEREKTRITRKLQAGAQVSADLRTLNEHTMDQNTSTKLDVLRYLGLEESRIGFKESGQTSRKVGKTELFIRSFSIQPEENVTYKEALRLIDWMHSNKAATINSISIKPGKGYGDRVTFELQGTLYGLQKK